MLHQDKGSLTGENIAQDTSAHSRDHSDEDGEIGVGIRQADICRLDADHCEESQPDRVHGTEKGLIEREAVRLKADENSGVRWSPFAEAMQASSEPWMAARIYKKLIDKEY